MALAFYSTDLVNVIPQDTASTGNWAALGGGASGLNVETDYFINGINCVSKNAFANATKGMVEDTTNNLLTVGDLAAVYTWITHLTPGSLDLKANGGLSVVMGTSAAALNRYYYAGTDTIDYGAPWICAVIDPENATPSSGTILHADMDTYGVEAKLVGGPTKGAPLAVDAIRQGRRYDVTEGEAVTPGNFKRAGEINDLQINRLGQFQPSIFGFFMQCLFGIGTAATFCYFEDSDKNIVLADLEFVHPDFIVFEVTNVGTTLKWTKINITALGKNTRGNFSVVSSLLIEHTSCNFIGMGWFDYDANSALVGNTWRGCRQITLNGGTMSGSTVDTPDAWDTSLDGYDMSLTSSLTGFTHLFSSQTSDARALHFSPDGLNFFILDGSTVYEYNVPDPYDLGSSATYSGNSFSIATQNTNAQGLTFNNDGTQFFVSDASTNNIFEYTVSVGFDLSSTVAYSGNSYNVGTQDTAQTALAFSPDGLKMFMMGGSTAVIYEYTLSLAFDITSTVTYTGNSVSALTEEAFARDFFFSLDGLKIFVMGTGADAVLEYVLDDAFDLTAWTYTGNSQSVSGQSAAPRGLAFSPDGTRYHMVGTDTIHEYDSGGSALSAVLPDAFSDITGNTFIANGMTHAVEIIAAFASDTTITWDNFLQGFGPGNKAIRVNVNSLRTLTINVADGADTPEVTNIGNGTVVVVTGQRTFSFTVNPSITGYEWRLYEKDVTEGTIGTVELAGQETATQDNQSYAYSYVSDKVVILQIIADGFEESLTELTLKNANLDLTINLQNEENT